MGSLVIFILTIQERTLRRGRPRKNLTKKKAGRVRYGRQAIQEDSEEETDVQANDAEASNSAVAEASNSVVVSNDAETGESPPNILPADIDDGSDASQSGSELDDEATEITSRQPKVSMKGTSGKGKMKANVQLPQPEADVIAPKPRLLLAPVPERQRSGGGSVAGQGISNVPSLQSPPLKRKFLVCIWFLIMPLPLD
ncbi:hypothetical protein Hypma_002117 [Hypsizygus marmoreus]|uniref:Uncharacterized protein n=1 Tax=Hypsizygus marmoreus TaxID=39966 RepID=A0A369K586_HYPMA|nr:hypothetical protein Hypma_002117 [Hypsizygus marmoreus]